MGRAIIDAMTAIEADEVPSKLFVKNDFVRCGFLLSKNKTCMKPEFDIWLLKPISKLSDCFLQPNKAHIL